MPPESWLQAAIRPTQILWSFQELNCVSKALKRGKAIGKVMSGVGITDAAALNATVDTEGIERLQNAFKIAFPTIFHDMEDFKSNLPDLTEELKGPY
jgi:hypothetical protein